MYEFRKDFWESLQNLNRTISSEDSSTFLELLQTELPLKINAFESGSTHGTWQIPAEWNLRAGKIIAENFKLNSNTHKLLVQPYSEPVHVKLQKSELGPHVIFDKMRPDDFIYYSKLAYQYPKNISWKVSIPYNTWQSMPDQLYEVEIDSEFRTGAMKIGEAELVGSSKKTVVFVAHYCHPYQFDDGLGGVLTAVRMYHELKKKKQNLTYKFLFLPETIGSVVHLLSLKKEELSNIVGGFFVEAPGKLQPLSIKKPHKMDTEFSKVVMNYFHENIDAKNIREFRANVSNDEIVFGDPDFDIPIFSLQRWPYDEYHTERDNITNFNLEKFDETFNHLLRAVYRIDNNFTIKRMFRGPLYMYGQDLHTNYADDKRKFFDDWEIMNASGESLCINLISEKTNIPFEVVAQYYEEYENKKLVSRDINGTY